MDKRMYQHIRYLANNLLNKSNADHLPVKVTPIAKLYGVTEDMNYALTRYENMQLVSEAILRIFGYPSEQSMTALLSNRILAPPIILRAIDVATVDETMNVCDIPGKIARACFDTLRGSYPASHIEQIILARFRPWIIQYNTNKPP